jgi:nucleoside-diphosphate-sugar epimerase
MTQADNRVLVTGATGFLGGWLVNRLSADGVPVRALARRPDRDRYIKDLPHVEIVQGDITDGARMQEVIQRCSVVYHVAAALGGNIDHQRRVNVGGTRTVAEAAASVGVRRIVHVSTIAVYGYRNRADVTEDTPFDPGHDPYNITKAEAETALREVCAAHGLEYTIIRPGMIYGPRSNTWTRIMFRLARRKPTIFIGDGSGSAYPIHVDDVVDLMTVLASHDATPGEAFNCTPDPSPTWRDFLGAYSRLAGHDAVAGVAGGTGNGPVRAEA